MVSEAPRELLPLLGQAPAVDGEARLYVAWTVDLDGSADTTLMKEVSAAGGTPWMRLRLRTPAPVVDHLEQLGAEIEEIVRLARSEGERPHFQLVWEPAGEAPIEDLAFLLKRAAVAVTGANRDARVLAGPLPADPETLRQLYAEEVAAYLDGVALAPASSDALAAALATLTELDPGKPVTLDALPWPADSRLTLARAAEAAQAGVAVTLFALGDQPAEDIAPLKVLSREFQGDLSFDPYSLPRGAARAWTFVRGSDLGLRVVAEPEAGDGDFELLIDDPQLRSPTWIDTRSGAEELVFSQRRTTTGLALSAEDPAPVMLLRLERMTAAELEGIEEQVTVASERQLPVEEILRRLQASEDSQTRRIEHYEATNTMHLRFRLGAGVNTLEASFKGRFFFRRGAGFDWTWDDLFINGVRWRGKKLPEIPLIQPEKAAVLPLEINFNKDYSYRLRGTAITEGRDCWVVDFEPLEAKPGLHQGTVWVDRELFVRVKTRSLQVGLEGEVISSEETQFFTPLDEQGQPTEWATASFFLPLRITGQQLLSVLNATTQVERETLLTSVSLNTGGFDARLEEAYASEATMVRDTEEGLKYLIKGEDGERVVKEGFDADRIFLLGGVFYDDSQDFPVPLAGINYLSLDFRGSGNQVNVFFGGVLLTANVAEPRLFGSRWDAGANFFGFFLPTNEELYRGNQEILGEKIESSSMRAALFLGRPIGNYTKLDFAYRLERDDFGRHDDTAEEFILPQDTLTHGFETELTYSRSGYRFAASGSFNSRSDWQFWGLPGNTEFDLEQEDYTLWQASLAKTWWLPKFTKLGIELEHLNGSDLDRFSKYDFNFFGDATVRGYPSGLVRASEADGFHLSYGFDFAELFRVELAGDAVWASDEATGLDRELLAGIGLNGTVMGPWQTIVNFDLGFPVDGPADGFVAYVVFLKLFN